jgi:hypothetical protein
MDLKNAVLFMVPDALKGLSPMLGALATSLFPITVFNGVVYFLMFLIVYMTNIFGWAKASKCGCKGNKPTQSNKASAWRALTNSYWLYLPVALLINYSSFL